MNEPVTTCTTSPWVNLTICAIFVGGMFVAMLLGAYLATRPIKGLDR